MANRKRWVGPIPPAAELRLVSEIDENGNFIGAYHEILVDGEWYYLGI